MQTAPEALTAPAQPSSLPLPSAISSASSLSASQCIFRAVLSSAPCERCSAGSIAQRISVTNRCARTVRCDSARAGDAAMQIEAMQSRVQTLIVQAGMGQDQGAVSPAFAGACRYADGLN